MADAFIESDNSGLVFWPDKPVGHDHDTKALQLSRDRKFISEKLKQLIYRTNVIEFGNSKRKSTAHVNARFSSDISSTDDVGIPPSPEYGVFRAVKRGADCSRKQTEKRPLSSMSQVRSARIQSGIEAQSKRRKVTHSPDKEDDSAEKIQGPDVRWSARARSRPEKPGYVSFKEVDQDDDIFSGPQTPPPPKRTATARKSGPPTNAITREKMAVNGAPSTVGNPSLSSSGSAIDSLEHSEPSPDRTLPQSTITENPARPHTQLMTPTKSPVAEFKMTYIVLAAQSDTTAEYVPWHPVGRFRDKTLEQLIQQLPIPASRRNMTSLIFRFSVLREDLNDYITTSTIDHHDEYGFMGIKRRLCRRMEQLLREMTTKPLVFEMEIEPVYEVEEHTAEKNVDW